MEVKSFLKNMAKYCIPSVVSALVGIAVIPLVSRVYPTADYGKINLFYSVGNMLMYIVLLGLDSAYIRYFFEQPDKVERKQLFQLALWVSIILDCLLCMIAVGIFPRKVCDYLFGEEKIALVFLLAIYIIGLVLFRLLTIENRMENRVARYNLQQILLIFTNRVSFVMIALFSTDYKYAIITITACSIILGLSFLFTQKKRGDLAFPRIPSKALINILFFAIPLMPTTVMTWLNNSVAKMVLSGYDDFDSVGVLSIATSVANVFSVLPSAFATYWSPFMYKNYKEQQDFIKKVHSYICMLSVVIVLTIFLLQDILYFIVGDSYKASQAYFLLVMLMPIQTLLCETTSYGIILSNKTKYNLYISIATVSANVIVGIVLYPIIGSIGVIVGIAGAAVLQLILKSVIGQMYYDSIENQEKTILAICLIVAISISNIWLYDNINVRLVIGIGMFILFARIYRAEMKNVVEFIKKSNLKKNKQW